MDSIEAVAVISNTTINNLSGFVLFREDLKNKETKITVKIKGLLRYTRISYSPGRRFKKFLFKFMCSLQSKNKNHGIEI